MNESTHDIKPDDNGPKEVKAPQKRRTANFIQAEAAQREDELNAEIAALKDELFKLKKRRDRRFIVSEEQAQALRVGRRA